MSGIVRIWTGVRPRGYRSTRNHIAMIYLTVGSSMSQSPTPSSEEPYFDGLVDELRIYDRRLTAAEIQDDRDTQMAPP